jgi:hypothetical protein
VRVSTVRLCFNSLLTDRSKRRETSSRDAAGEETRQITQGVTMAGKSVEKYVVMAQGKIDGKLKIWVAGVFNDVKQAKPWVALLALARKASDHETVASMDVHQPPATNGGHAADVKYSGSVIQYAPEASALSDDTELG